MSALSVVRQDRSIHCASPHSLATSCAVITVLPFPLGVVSLDSFSETPLRNSSPHVINVRPRLHLNPHLPGFLLSRMIPLHIFSIVLVSALLSVSVSGQCTSPKVRREWRSISPDERASWLKAIKVTLTFDRVPSLHAKPDDFSVWPVCRTILGSLHPSILHFH